MPVSAGDSAPDFTLTNSADLEKVSLSDYRGKNVVLAFFPAAFTGVCQTELCTFRDSLSQFESLDAQVLAISADPPFSQKEFASQNSITFPVLSDTGREVINSYGVEFQNLAGVEGYNVAQRSVFVIDKEGNVSWSWIADAPPNEPPYSEVESAVKALA